MTIKQLLATADEQGWFLSEQIFIDNRKGYELAKYSPAGQDFVINLESTDDEGRESANTLVNSLEAYVNGFDPDEEASLWIWPDEHGKNVAPYKISDIIKDMEWCHSACQSLLQAWKDIQ